MSSRLRGTGLIGAVVAYMARAWTHCAARLVLHNGSNCSLSRAMDGRSAPQYHQLMPISCHCLDCKAPLATSLLK